MLKLGCFLIAALVQVSYSQSSKLGREHLSVVDTKSGRHLTQDEDTTVYNLPGAQALPEYLNLGATAATPGGEGGGAYPDGAVKTEITNPADERYMRDDVGSNRLQPEEIQGAMVAMANSVARAAMYIQDGIKFILAAREFEDAEAPAYLKQFSDNLQNSIFDIARLMASSYPDEAAIRTNGTTFWPTRTMPKISVEDGSCYGTEPISAAERFGVPSLDSTDDNDPNTLVMDRCPIGSALATHAIGTVIGLSAMAKGVAAALEVATKIITMTKTTEYNFFSEAIDTGLLECLETISEDTLNTFTVVNSLIFGTPMVQTSGRKLKQTDADVDRYAEICQDIGWLDILPVDLVDVGSCSWNMFYEQITDQAAAFAEVMRQLKGTAADVWKIGCNVLAGVDGRILDAIATEYPLKPCSELGCIKCVQPRMGTAKEGVDVVISSCVRGAAAAAQQWEFVQADIKGEMRDQYQIKARNASVCLNAPRQVRPGISTIRLGRCTDSAQNTFKVVQVDVKRTFTDERFLLLHVDSKTCIGVQPDVVRGLRRLQLDDCKCTVGQMWKGLDTF